MPVNGIQLEIEEEPQLDQPDQSIRLERINYILGRNGGGKTRLLGRIGRALRTQEGERSEVRFIPSNRAAPIPNQFLPPGQANLMSPRRDTWEDVNSEKNTAQRVHRKLSLVVQDAARKELEHLRLYKKWSISGPAGPQPKEPVDEVDQVFAFVSSILPDINPHLLENKDGLLNLVATARRDGVARYQIDMLSEGEKQVLLIAIDILALPSDKPGFIIVDEPELHLHPGNASRLWRAIEKARPGLAFIYATHSVQFAEHQESSATFIIDKGGPTSRLDSLESLPRSLGAELLSAVSGPHGALRTGLCEGSADGLEADFYTQATGIRFIGAGSKKDVVKIYSALATASWISVVCLVDHDEPAHKEPAEASVGYVTTPYWEWESLFCSPAVIFKVLEELQRLGNFEEAVTQDRVHEFLFQAAESQAKLSAVKFGNRWGVTAEQQLTLQAQHEDAFKEAVQSGNTEQALKLITGKELLSAIAKRVGISPDMYIKSAFRPALELWRVAPTTRATQCALQAPLPPHESRPAGRPKVEEPTE